MQLIQRTQKTHLSIFNMLWQLTLSDDVSFSDSMPLLTGESVRPASSHIISNRLCKLLIMSP